MKIIELGSITADTKLALFSGPWDSIPQPCKYPEPV